jgi:ABC-type glycerol-3-phosphate transport system substrate-binding protein
MWEQEWSGGGVWGGFKSGDVFLSFMTQLDCFFIHGTGRDGLDGYVENPDDLGFAIMPGGCSVDLDANADYRRTGTRSITTGGWWWGVPASTPYPELSVKLAEHITSTNNQIQGCTRFGMIPVRKDILSDMSMMFGGGWITRVYETSFTQLMHNKNTTVPVNPRYSDIANLYLDAWYDIVVQKNWSEDNSPPSLEYIAELLRLKYQPRADAILQR